MEMGKPGADGGESCFDYTEVRIRYPSGIIRRPSERYLILLYLGWSVGFWPVPALASFSKLQTQILFIFQLQAARFTTIVTIVQLRLITSASSCLCLPSRTSELMRWPRNSEAKKLALISLNSLLTVPTFNYGEKKNCYWIKVKKKMICFLASIVGVCITDWSFLPSEAIFIRHVFCFAFN